VKFKKSDVLSSKETIEFKEELTFDSNAFINFSRLNSLEDCDVSGTVFYDDEIDVVEIELHVEGIMICPCAITNEDVEVPFDLDSFEVFKFSKTKDENIHQVAGETLDLYPIIFQLILSEVPIKVVKDNVEYPKGKDWEVLTEAEYEEEKGKEIDPRLAKLKQLKFDNE
jgi:uncharacterized protein